MNFELTEEQVMLKDSAARFIQAEYDQDTRREIVASDTGMSAKHWSSFAELGWLSIPFAEEYGGFGGNVMDIAAIMEELGKGLVVEPFLATVQLFGGLLAKSDNQALKQTYIPKIVSGDCLGAFAYIERQSRFALNDVLTSARKTASGYNISGEKVLVSNGSNANSLIVAARTSGEQADESGISLFLVDTDTADIIVSSYKLMDGQKVANITFNNVTVPSENLIGIEGQGLEQMKAVIMEATISVCAEALGIMEKLNHETLEYARVRKQFSTTIGSFQALQHRMVDTFMSYQQSKSMLFRTLCEWKEQSQGEQTPETLTSIEKTVHALKAQIGKAGKHIGAEAIQIHGGMGITDELIIGHLAKRLMMINATFGDVDYQQQKFNQLSYA